MIAFEISGEGSDAVNATIIRDLNEFAREFDENMVGGQSNGVLNNTSGRGPQVNRELLAKYYEDYFPVKKIARWLGYGNERSYFSNREFSFTLQNDIYIRYLSFDGYAGLASRLKVEVPVKIDIGAVYNTKPNERKTIAGSNLRAVERELVFDIDMTDYDDVRTCCRDKKICRKCWKFLAIAVKILDTVLREDFAFKNILWVFSGRRGVHCWVADRRARQLSHSSRKAIVSYLDLAKDRKRKMMSVADVSAPVERASMLTRNYFSSVALLDQKVLATPESRSKFLELISDDQIRSQVAQLWSDGKVCEVATPEDYWKMLTDFIRMTFSEQGKGKQLGELFISDLTLRLLHPRLDAHVSIQLNHLLKSPFCIHPGTGRICVPFEASQVDAFDPDGVPTVVDLVVNETVGSRSSWNDALEIFDRFISQLEDCRRGELSATREDSCRSLAF